MPDVKYEERTVKTRVQPILSFNFNEVDLRAPKS